MTAFPTQSGRSTERVLIAGAGPVGLATALALARADVPVTVLEKGSGPGTASRASTLHPPALEFLAELGVVEEIEQLGLRSQTFQQRSRSEGLVAEFDLAVLADETDFPYRVQLEQDKICRLLAEALQMYDHAEVRTGRTVRDVRQAEGGVSVVSEVEDGESEAGGHWLVGADGAHSAVRQALDIAHEGITYPQRFLVLSTPDELRDVLPDIALVNYVSDPGEWVVLLRTPDHWRLLFPVGTDEDEAAVTAPDALQARVQAVAPRDEPWNLVQHSLYEIHQRVAERFRDGRVLLAGDAAHLNNPLGGMGMNSGLLDAWSLSRRLADVWHGRAGDEVLDEYATRRREVALDVVDRETRANKQRMEADGAERDRAIDELRAVAADPDRARDHLRRITLLEAARTTL